MVRKGTEDIAVSEFVDAVIGVRQAIKQVAQQKLREWHDREITYEMLQVLTVLWKKHEINQQEVANTIQKNKASLTPLLDSLVQMGLVTRSEDPGDRRNKIITLTRKGKEYKKKFTPMINTLYRIVKGTVPDHRLEEATVLLRTIRENMTIC